MRVERSSSAAAPEPRPMGSSGAGPRALAPLAVLLLTGQSFVGCAGGVGALPFGAQRLLEGWVAALQPQVAWLGLAALPGGGMPSPRPPLLRGLTLLPELGQGSTPADMGEAVWPLLPEGQRTLLLVQADAPCPGEQRVAEWLQRTVLGDTPAQQTSAGGAQSAQWPRVAQGWHEQGRWEWHTADAAEAASAQLPPPVCTQQDYRAALAAAGHGDASAPAVTVELFGSLRQRSGLVQLPLYAGTVGHALDLLRQVAPGTGKLLPAGEPFERNWRYAVNGGQVGSDTGRTLQEGDVLTIFSASVGG